MKEKGWPRFCLRLFEGGEAASGETAVEKAGLPEQGAAVSSAETGRGAGGGRRAGQMEESMRYGRQDREPESQGEGKGPARQTVDPEERQKAFQALIRGEYRQEYDQELQRIMGWQSRRTRELEAQAGQVRPLLEQLAQRYGVEAGDLGRLSAAVERDNSYWEWAAERAGMPVEQFKQFQRLRQQNAALIRAKRQEQRERVAQTKLSQWYSEAEGVKRTYPQFELGVEARDPRFLALLRSGVPVRLAYEVLHLEELSAGREKSVEKRVVDSIMAKGTRPRENGGSAQSGFTVKDNVSLLTRQDRAEIARRAARGERIIF